MQNSRFMQTRQMQDLEKVMELNREALALRPPSQSNRPYSLYNLAMDLRSRFTQTRKMQDLEEAIELNREALALLPSGDSNRSYFLYNLAKNLSFRFNKTGHMDDLEKTIEYYREAIGISPAGSLRSFSLVSLSHALLGRFEKIFRKNDLHEAFDTFAAATEIRSAGVDQQISAARSWVWSACEFRHRSLLSAYARYLDLLQCGIIISPSLELQWASLTKYSSSLAVVAASSAIDKGRPDIAVEMLEQGRALLWSRMKGYRQPVLELRTVDQTLADRFETVSDQLEKLATSRSRLAPDALEPAPLFGPAWDKKLKQQRVLSAEWDDIVKRIRQIEGFSDFLQPVPFGRLKHAAAEGPVIIVNVSSYRLDALILRDVASDPTIVPLTASLHDEVGKLSE